MRPTTRGMATVLAGGCLLAAGAGLGYPELAVVGACALLAATVAAVHVSIRPGLTVTRRVDPDRVGRGESCGQVVTVRNRGRWRAVTLLAEDRCGGLRVPVPLLRLPPGRDTRVDYPVPTHRRGVVTVGPLSVRRADPLGLFQAVRSHGPTAQVWVYPQVHPLVAVPAGIARSLDGRLEGVPHGSITFDTLRQYVIGDELRRVHWRTSARVGELMVREFVDTSLPRIVVLLDDRAGGYHTPDDFEAACEAAASVLVAAVREDLAVRLLPLSTAGPAGRPGQRRRLAGAGGDDGSAEAAGGGAAGEGPTGGGRRALGPSAARRADPGPLLDLLAEAELTGQPSVPDSGATADRGGDSGGDPHLVAVLRRLRQSGADDTLVFLTGTRRPDDLAAVGALRGRYPTIVAGAFGDPAGLPVTVDGLHLLAVPDGAAFAAAWDGIGSW